MAFQMIHMEIAYELLKHFSFIKNEEEFMLGAVAPDCVHMNAEYDISMKVKTHLFEGCGPWSDTRDYDRWIKNIFDFWNQYTQDFSSEKERDYIAGICVHCLTDRCNDLKLWREFQKIYVPIMGLEQFKESFYPEAKGIDIWLYQNSKHCEEIRRLLKNGQIFSLGGFLDITDMEKMKSHLLYEQYMVEKEDISNYKMLSQKRLEQFINESVEEIANLLL